MKKTKKALASLAIASMLLTAVPFNALADTTATRIFGADRIETAVNVANAGWATGAATVIVAPAADTNLVDALAAAPLAGQENAPILLTEGTALNAKTKQAIDDLNATKVIAVGALSDQVINDLKAISGVTVEQLKGADRIETATKIAAKLTAPAGSFVVGYRALADALSVASYAAANKYQILVANPDGSLPSSEVPVGTRYVIGGPTLVKDVTGATRLYGATRYDTNNEVVKALGTNYDTVFVANGEDSHLVDSLVASAYAAKTNSVIALTDNSTVKANAFLGEKMTDASTTVALGGTGVVSETVRASVKAGAVVVDPVSNVSATVVPGVGRSVAIGEALIKVATVNLSGTGPVTGMKVTRSGLSRDTDISGITVYDGDTRLNISAVVGDSVADFGFISPLNVSGSKTLDVYMTLANVGVAAGSQVAITVNEVKGATVVPATSGVYTLSNVNLGLIVPSIQAANPVNNLDPTGQAQLLHKYRFEASNEAVKLNKVTFTQMGSAGASDIKDLELWANGAKIAGPVQQSSDRTVTFTVDQTIAQGGRLDVDIMGKVIAGSGRTVRYELTNNVDVKATGQTYGTTLVSTAAGGAAYVTITPPGARLINPGSLTVSRDGTAPAAATISNNVRDYNFGVFSIQAIGEPIQLRTININAAVTGAGTLSAIDNLKIYAGDTVIGSDVNAFRNNNANNNETIAVQLSKPVTVTPGTPILIKLTADIKDNAANINGADAGTIFAATDTVRLALASVSQYALLTSGTTNGTGALNVAGNIMTVGNTGVTATFVPKSPISGYQNESAKVVAEFDLKTNLTEKVLVNSIPFKILVGAPANGWADLANVKITDADGNVLSNVEANPTGAADLRLYLTQPLGIEPNTTVRIKLVADVKSSAPNTGTLNFGIGGAAPSALSATTAVTGNDVTLVGAVDLAAVGSPRLTFTTAGANINVPTSLVVSTNLDITGAKTVGTTSKDVKVAGFKLTNSGSEPALIKKIVVSVDNGGAGTLLGNQRYSNIRIVDSAGTVLGSVAAIPGSQTWVAVDISPSFELKDGVANAKDIAIVADFNATSGQYGDTLRVGIGNAAATANIEAVTKFTGIACNRAAGATEFGVGQSVFRMVPTTLNVATETVSNPVAIVAGGAMANGSEIARFKFTNNGTEAVSLDTVQINDQLITNGLGGQVDARVTLFNGDGEVISAETLNWAGDAVQIPLTADLRIKAGETKVVSVKVTNAGSIIQGASMLIRLEKAGTFYEVAGVQDGAGAGGDFMVNDNAVAPQVRVAAP